MFRLTLEENGALRQHGSSAEEMATAKTQAETAEPPAVHTAHDKDLGLGVPTRPLGFSQTWSSFAI